MNYIKDLNNLRKKIDFIDKEILYLINERFKIVKQIGLIKKNNNIEIYDKDREKNILLEKINNNKYDFLSNEFIFNIFKLIFFESYKNQIIINNKYSNINITIIGGSGKMGLLFFDKFKISGYNNIYSINSSNWDDKIIKRSDLIIISVPISKFKNLIDKVLNINLLNKDCILLDLSSIKMDNINYMFNKYNGPSLSLHPMFGNINTFINQSILYIDGNYKEKYLWLLNQFKHWGLNLYKIKDSYKHDEYMKYIQSIRYILMLTYGFVLFNNKDIRDNKRFNINFLYKISPFFNKIIISLMIYFFNQNINLYLEIINSNIDINFIDNIINYLNIIKNFILTKDNKYIKYEFNKINLYINNKNFNSKKDNYILNLMPIFL